MNLPFIILDYVKGKSIYPPIRRSLNLLFTITITSFLFERLYFSYSIPDIKDYKLFINFFVKGYFIVPFCIFILVHGITYFIPMTFFSLYNLYYSRKITKKIIEFQMEQHNTERGFGIVRVLSEKIAPIKLDKEALINLYLEFKENIDDKVLDEIEKGCTDEKRSLEESFIFAFRALVSISFYFVSINHFGWKLFLITTIALSLYMIILILGYRFFDLVPTAIRKFKHEADKYVELNYSKFIANNNSLEKN